MNFETLFFILLICLFTAHGPVVGNPVKMKSGYFDPQNPDESLAFPEFLLPTTEYPIRPKVCHYKGFEYSDGAVVVTEEPCLKCKCLGGSLICYLRVCPTLPDPPPPHCVLVLRRGACCSELVCEDGGVATNHISRAEQNDLDGPVDSTISFGDGKGCIDNGTLYASGSAMSTSSLCEYCYCISGTQKCIKPKCLLPVPGCQPTRSPHSCCPISYSCNLNTTTSTTTEAIQDHHGCVKDDKFYPDGERVSTMESTCTNCFCIRGKVKCAKLSCAPPLLGCTPIIEPGKCCASSYNCNKNGNPLEQSNYNNLGDANTLSSDDKDTTINERSFPGDTLLTPSQIAEILLGSERRSTGNNNSEKQNGEKKNSKIAVTIVTTPDERNVAFRNTFDTHSSQPNKKNSTGSTLSVSNTLNIEKPVTTSIEVDSLKTKDRKEINGELNTVISKSAVKNSSQTESDVKKTSNSLQNKSDANDEVTSDEDDASVSTVVVLDTVNCTTEITSVDEANATDHNSLENTTEQLLLYNDTQERTPILSGSIDADESATVDENEDVIHENSTKNNIGSQFPSHSLIIPKDDDVFMVNVSTFVRTNTSVVTLKPVAAIPPEIEAILNMSNKNQKDDYFDYDYKSALPPSLPNLEIIPFLATDAVVNEKKDKEKTNTKYENVYPPIENKNYYDKFGPNAREKYNSTIYPYVSPTTYPSYLDDKYYSNSPDPNNNYNRNPVYKQHINDKFKTSTYSSINDKFDKIPFAQKKYDNIPAIEQNTETPVPVFDGKTNLFSPPVKTEGGFLPRDPPIDSYYDTGFSSTGEDSYSVTDSSLMVTNHAKITGDNCISNGRVYKNRELITEPHSCVVCFCYYGDIHCQDPECPPIKPGCRRIIEKGSSSCCGVEICNDDNFYKDANEKSEKGAEILKQTKTSTEAPIYKATTEITQFTTPAIESNVDGIIDEKSVVTTQANNVVDPSSTLKVAEKPNKVSTKGTTSTSPTTVSILSSTGSIKEEPIDAVVRINDGKLTPQKNGNSYNSLVSSSESSLLDYDTENELEHKTTSEIPPEESDSFSEDGDDDDAFNFDSVLKYLLGDDPTTKPPTKPPTNPPTKPPTKPSTKPPVIYTSEAYTTPRSHSTFSSPRIKLHAPTSITDLYLSSTPRPKYTVKSSTSYAPPIYNKGGSTLVPFRILTTQSPTVKSTPRFSYAKPVTLNTPQFKNFTKPKFSTKIPPIMHSTLNRFSKPKFSPSHFPATTESIKKIAPPYYTNERFQQTFKRKQSPSDSTLPFGSGLLKLAGCNIYGRMYRVGKIISELSGPCLECMCTEVGVQCEPLC